MQTMTLHFRPKKETQGTIVFEQVKDDGSPSFAPLVPSLYVKKQAWPMGDVPKMIRVIMEPVE